MLSFCFYYRVCANDVACTLLCVCVRACGEEKKEGVGSREGDSCGPNIYISGTEAVSKADKSGVFKNFRVDGYTIPKFSF